MIINLGLVALGGALGASIRFIINHFSGKGLLPLGTVTVNLLGCFLAGLLAGLASRINFPLQAKYFIFTGILGGMTTFSAFSLETFLLWQDGSRYLALINILINLTGLPLVYLGYKLLDKI